MLVEIGKYCIYPERYLQSSGRSSADILEGECSVFLSVVRAAVIMMVLHQPMLGDVVKVGVVARVVAEGGVSDGDVVEVGVGVMSRDIRVVKDL